MYWYEKRMLVGGVFLLQAFSGCHSAPEVRTGEKFFDLKGYFASEATRLKRQHPLVRKTVVRNTDSQEMQVHVVNWQNELSLFSQSDINKPAWRAGYDTQTSGDFLIYKARYPELKTREIVIKRTDGKMRWVLIMNHVRTDIAGKLLYESREKLSYFPDSLYLIQKRQTVRLIGTNNYTVRGSIGQ